MAFHTPAEHAAPSRGATINSHSCERAVPPAKTAGPILRAGLTEVPVIGIQTMCTRIKVNPMARPANWPAPCFSSVEPKTTRTNTNVNTA